jgi:hypothetical protein
MIESILSRLLVAVGFVCLSLPIDMKKCTIGLITSKPKVTLSERTQSPRGGRLCGEEKAAMRCCKLPKLKSQTTEKL